MSVTEPEQAAQEVEAAAAAGAAAAVSAVQEDQQTEAQAVAAEEAAGMAAGLAMEAGHEAEQAQETAETAVAVSVAAAEHAAEATETALTLEQQFSEFREQDQVFKEEIRGFLARMVPAEPEPEPVTEVSVEPADRPATSGTESTDGGTEPASGNESAGSTSTVRRGTRARFRHR